MDEKPDLIHISTAIGNPNRINILVLLMEGRALTAKELAYGAGIEPAAATRHLHQLVDAGLIHCVSQGRFRYFQLANPDVAMMVETMMTLAPHQKIKRKLPARELCDARYCYDHLAGKLGTQIYTYMMENDLLFNRYRNLELTTKGSIKLEKLGIDLAPMQKNHRKKAYQCLDWSERTFHTGGALGHLLASYFTESQWIRRRKNSRVVDLTTKGRELFSQQFSVKF